MVPSLRCWEQFHVPESADCKRLVYAEVSYSEREWFGMSRPTLYKKLPRRQGSLLSCSFLKRHDVGLEVGRELCVLDADITFEHTMLVTDGYCHRSAHHAPWCVPYA